jgi:hypothetical protein
MKGLDMARVVFDANDIDQEFQIEDGIRRTLDANHVASIEQAVINECYDLYDPNGTNVEGDINDRSTQIAQRGNLDYSLHENLAVFRRKPK